MFRSKKLKISGQEIDILNCYVNEDLGQVKHVFSDKTGTLTTNYMILNYLVVGD